MDSGLMRKIEKAKRYAEERDRIRIDSLTVTFDGDNNPHTVNFQEGVWHCDCDFSRAETVQPYHGLEIILMDGSSTSHP
jgi:hypothetical protein